jgi:signal transduction histidine kinase
VTPAHRFLVARPGSGTLVDVAIAAGAFVGSMAILSRQGASGLRHDPSELDAISVVLTVCSTAPLVAWRRDPRAVFAVTASAAVLLVALGYAIGVPLGPTAALYLLAASRDEEAPWTRQTRALVAALFAVYLSAAAAGKDHFPGSELLHGGLAWAVAWFAGERTRLRREQIAELSERAKRADREAEQERRLALAEERTRIARDLHDSAGHAINVIAIRAGAARMRQDPERSQAALAAIEEIARDTVGEIDQIVGALRDPASSNGEIPAPPGLASLQALVTHHSEGGLEVTVATTGAPHPLAPGVDLAAYRILQEALTNAARHGTGAAQVAVAFEEDSLQLSVSNAVAEPPPQPTTRGHGLIGMRERATLLDGSLEIDRANGTFRLRARLPYGGHTA